MPTAHGFEPDDARRDRDAALVALARSDPSSGWAAIWDAHGAALHRYCTRLLDTRVDADDVVAEVFLAAATRLDQLRDPSALRTWLFAIARRQVQRRWRARARSTPVDPHGATMNAAAPEVSTEASGLAGVHAADAEALVRDVAAGLSIKDRDLLALTLGADLDTTEVARITGERPNAIAVRVTRLKETLGRSAGALLVARHHRRDCPELDRILDAWDGTFDTVWRKRIARHIDGCSVCERRRAGAVAVFAAPLPLLVPPPSLRDRVLESVRSVTTPDVSSPPADPTPTDSSPADPVPVDTVPVDPVPVDTVLTDAVPVLATVDSTGEGELDDLGVPAPEPWEPMASHRPLLALAVVGVLVAIALGWWALGPSHPHDVGEVATAGASAGPPSAPAPTLAPAPTSPAPTVSTTATTVAEVVTPTSAPATTAPTPPDVTVAPSPPPTVSLRVDPAVATSCNPMATATVLVGAGSGSESTTISWGGGAPGVVTVNGPGTHTVEVGPMATVDGALVYAVPVTATTTDSAGARAVASDTVTLELIPC